MPRRLTIGLDIGGTKLLGVLWDGRRIVHRTMLPSGARGGRKTMLAAIGEAIGALRRPGVRAIGVALPGVVDRNGVFRSGPHGGRSAWGWDPRKTLHDRYRLPVAVLNDAQAFTFAEARTGAGKGKALVAGIAIGTGLGGGIVQGGKIVRGKHGSAGEFGHMTIRTDAPVRCVCGASAHLEAFVSGTAARRAWSPLSGTPYGKTDVFALERAARKDRKAAHLWKHLQASLAIGFANVLATIDPDVIVIGGGLGRARSLWVPAARMARSHLFTKRLADTPIVPAHWGDAAGAVGAALYAHPSSPHQDA